MNLEIGEVLMRSVNWLIIGFVVIILAASIIYSSLSYNNLSVIVETNGSNTDVNYNSILSSSLPPVMVNEIKNKALEDVDYLEENEYNFYYADSELTMRLNDNGWKTITLDDCLADHLVHKPSYIKNPTSPSTIRDSKVFYKRYPEKCNQDYIKKEFIKSNNLNIFWKVAPINCILGLILKLYDKFNFPNYNKT